MVKACRPGSFQDKPAHSPKPESGTLSLTQANTYSGGTTVNGGTLLLDGGAGGNSRICGALTVNSGATVNFANDDGTRLGWIGAQKATSLTINDGTVLSAGIIHAWDLAGGVSMTGGTLQSNGGVSTTGGNRLEWYNSDVTTLASASTATIAGQINMRADGGATGITLTVADGAATTDLLVSAGITESANQSINKQGAGTMTLSGASTYTGTTTIRVKRQVACKRQHGERQCGWRRLRSHPRRHRHDQRHACDNRHSRTGRRRH